MQEPSCVDLANVTEVKLGGVLPKVTNTCFRYIFTSLAYCETVHTNKSNPVFKLLINSDFLHISV